MKQQSKWLAAAIAVASGLIIANSAQAQYVNTDATLDNITTTGNGTLTSGSTIGATGLTLTEPTGFGYGWDQYNIPTADQPVFSPGDDEIIFTYTINSPTPGTTGTGYPSGGAWSWESFQPLLGWSPVAGGYASETETRYFGYDGYNLSYGFPNGQGIANQDPGYSYNPATQVVTITAALTAGDIAEIEAGGKMDNFQISADDESLPDGYSLTFNSIQLVPEPTTLALAGLGTIGLLAFRRRNK